MSDFRQHIDREMIRYLVQRQISCPYSNDVLDVRTCAVIRDQDGDPVRALCPSCGKTLAENAEKKGGLGLAEGYTLDLRKPAR